MMKTLPGRARQVVNSLSCFIMLILSKFLLAFPSRRFFQSVNLISLLHGKLSLYHSTDFFTPSSTETVGSQSSNSFAFPISADVDFMSAE